MQRSAVFFLAARAAAALPDAGLLPDVATLMLPTAKSLAEFRRAKEAVDAERRVVQEELSREETAMLQNITSLAAEIRQCAGRNAATRMSIEAMQRKTNEQREVTKRMQSANNFLRYALSAFESKMHIAHDFIGESLNATDDAGARELQVLRTTTSPPDTVAAFLSTIDKDLDPTDSGALDRVSLLSTDRDRTAGKSLRDTSRSNTKSLLLISSFQKLIEGRSGVDGAAQVTGQFIALYEHGAKHLRELREEGDMFGSRLRDLANEQKALAEATARLKKTHADLNKRLSGLKQFAAKVGPQGQRAVKKSERVLVAARDRAAAVSLGGRTATYEAPF